MKIDAANWDEDEIFRNLISVVTGFDSETEDLQNRMETAEAVYERHTSQISNIIDRINPLIERTGGSGEDAQPMRRAPSPWDEYRGMKHIQLLPKEEEGAVLTQDDFTEENAIYIIQYDFTVDNTITIPENCIFKFDGGSIAEGTLVGQNTILVYNQPLSDILTSTLEGTWRHESGVKADEEDITDINGELKFKDKAYVPANYSGLGRKYLRKNIVNSVNTLTQSMINEANTIYVIQYDYTLDEDITIPDNCVLEFDGGSINGTSTLTFQKTEILGILNSISHTIGLAGTIKGSVNIAYWNLKYNDNTYDNGVVINKVCSVFKNVYIPVDNLYFTTPIVMNAMELIQCDATLIYKGTTTNTAAVKVTRGQGIYNFNRIFGQFNINYTEANNTKVIGLDFNSCNGCELSFNYITGFNEGLRVSDTNNTGCCSNTIYVGLIAQTNFGIRIYQGGSDTNWCNQNLFLSGRITNWTGWDFNNPTWCVFAYGAKYEGQGDLYDSVNNLTFIGLCVEEQNGIYLRNGEYIKIIGTRHENSTHPLKLVGNCGAVEWNPSYPANGKIDVTENRYHGLSVRSQEPDIIQTVYDGTPVEVDTTIGRAFTANSFKLGRIMINYLEDTNGPLDTREKKMAYPSMGNYYFDLAGILDPGADGYGMGDDIFFIPEGITKISIEFQNNTGGTLKLYRVL